MIHLFTCLFIYLFVYFFIYFLGGGEPKGTPSRGVQIRNRASHPCPKVCIPFGRGNEGTRQVSASKHPGKPKMPPCPLGETFGSCQAGVSPGSPVPSWLDGSPSGAPKIFAGLQREPEFCKEMDGDVRQLARMWRGCGDQHVLLAQPSAQSARREMT